MVSILRINMYKIFANCMSFYWNFQKIQSVVLSLNLRDKVIWQGPSMSVVGVQIQLP